MLKSALLASLIAVGIMVSGVASAHDYGAYESDSWDQEQPTYLGNPGGYFSIRVVPPPPPRPHYVERCMEGNRIDQMQAEQSSLINAGYADGGLTESEMNMLFAQQDRIADIEDRMRSDGCLTMNERNDLLARLDQANRDIWRERNNDRRRGWHQGRPHHSWNHNNR